jgi:CheY-like chemotaxis protein
MADDPTDAPTPDDDSTKADPFIDRRSGRDRRSGGERRHGGRRYRRLRVGEDRRTGSDRRGPDRRSGTDRRIYNDPRYHKPRTKREAPPGYSAEDAAKVRHILSHVGHRPVCPVCEGAFTLGPADYRGADSVRHVSCADCGRGTVVTNCLLARVMIFTRVEAMSKLLRAVLMTAGHDVVQPPHTGLAITVYRENPPDAVIMDTFALTEMDGQEFIRQLRMESADARIIVLAPKPNYRMADPSATARHLGATCILRTPFTRDDLLKAVKEARR